MEQNNEEVKNITIGSLFNTIHYVSPQDLDKFITNLTKEQSLYCLIEGIKYAHSKGVFTLEESECISKSIRQFQLPVSE